MLKKSKFFLLILILMIAGCHAKTVNKKTLAAHKTKSQPQQITVTNKVCTQKGIASWYGKKFHKRRTSSGERYNMYQLTAAHRTLPFATRLLVTNERNGRQVIVRVNDRGPFKKNRMIDLSYAAAKKLGMVGSGLAKVSIKVLPTKQSKIC